MHYFGGNGANYDIYFRPGIPRFLPVASLGPKKTVLSKICKQGCFVDVATWCYLLLARFHMEAEDDHENHGEMEPPCMEYLPTYHQFMPNVTLNISYLEHLG